MINYLVGDATEPQGTGKKIIPHIVNDIGAWGSGFVVAVSQKWPEPEACYRAWHQGLDSTYFNLGETQFVSVSEDITIANMVAQRSVRRADNPRPIRYGALRDCLHAVAEEARRIGATIHMPRIGTERAGGKWEDVQHLIEAEMPDISVFVYDLPEVSNG